MGLRGAFGSVISIPVPLLLLQLVSSEVAVEKKGHIALPPVACLSSTATAD